ncbi:LysR family transcriptional regulator [Kribbella sandramycini]|uniref:DNA-binding transcriptional LysR family regulator n=1 Tax=Kribbella sandramycini TaxID=60450 RepID=A0A7Y4P076_9ACTN|nr:LysR family transcriptional regulator [Kribbella sandramycini]MBB6566486.1 DNA-binding transcriptional LysR family regulator [Kribbella sandramycini]NOL42857.1 LysR family transcriptional regulator [Kribbella sandramycini]
MDLRLLRAFVVVARVRTYGGAAAELAMSQPALTKQIQVLERRVGAVLFVRGRHGARVTAAGEALLPDALELLERADAFERRAAQVAAGLEGSLAVGFGLSGIELAPRAVALFRSRWPRVSVSLEDMSSEAQYERLRSGALQVGFVRLPVPAGLEHLRLRKDRLALALPVDQAVPRDLASWLDGRPLVRLVPERGPGLTAQINGLYAEHGCRPEVLQEARDVQTLLALTAAGAGPAVVPQSAERIAPGEVRLVPLPGRAATWWIGAAWSTRAPLTERFLKAATEVARG